MKTSMAVVVALALSIAPVASFAATTTTPATTAAAASTKMAATKMASTKTVTTSKTTTTKTKMMTKADRCSALESQFDAAVKTHAKAKHLTVAEKLRVEAGKLCSSKRYTSGIVKLKSALNLLDVKPLKA